MLRVVGAVVVVVLAGAAWVGVRGWMARGHLIAASALVPQVETQALAGGAATEDVHLLQQETSSAVRLTGDPVWGLATRLPWVGDDLGAVRAAARAVDGVSQEAVPSLTLVATSLSPAALRPQAGRFDLAPLEAAQEPLRRAEVALVVAQGRLAPYVAGATSLIRPVRHAVTDLDTTLATISTQVSAGRRAADLLPPMLGLDGRRTYLVIFQNLAEARSMGGIAGAFAVVEADHGAVRIVHQGRSGDFPHFTEPVVTLSEPEQRLYQKPTTTFFQNVTQPIDFSVGARIAREMWRRQSGTTVDGVVATDPVALSYVLKATGAVQVPAGADTKIRLTSENVVRLLLSDVYARYPDPSRQDAFFAAAAASVFQALVSGPGDPKVVLDQLGRAAAEHRLLVWSAHAPEQRRIEPTVLSGVLPVRETSRPTVGVFLNEATASKMSYYLKVGAVLADLRCRPDGKRPLELDVALSSQAPDRGLTRYVAGRVKPYEVSTVVYLVSPVGGGVASLDLDGKALAANTQVVGDRTVSVVTVDLRPGEAKSLHVRFVSPDIPGRPRLRISPTVRSSIRPVTLSDC